MHEHIPQNKSQWIGFLSFAALNSAIEFCIGKTKRIPANSILELLELSMRLVINKVLEKLTNKKEK